MLIWWILMTIVMMVIQGQMDRQIPSRQQYHQFGDPELREKDEFDHYNEGGLDEKYSRPYGPRPQRPSFSSMEKISRMGEDFKLRMQNLRSMISGQTRSNSYEESSSSSYAGCCDKLDFNTVVPGFVLVAVSYMLLFLLNATVTSGRRRRMVTSSREEEESKFFSVKYDFFLNLNVSVSMLSEGEPNLLPSLIEYMANYVTGTVSVVQ
jgi:hypothetical protein